MKQFDITSRSRPSRVAPSHITTYQATISDSPSITPYE